MIIRLYSDEDMMQKSLLHALRSNGVNVLTTSEAGMRNRSDQEQLEYATLQGRVMITFNKGHFLKLHKEYMSQGKRHSGIILVTQQEYSIGESVRRILRIVNGKSAEEMENNVEFLSNWGERHEP